MSARLGHFRSGPAPVPPAALARLGGGGLQEPVELGIVEMAQRALQIGGQGQRAGLSPMLAGPSPTFVALRHPLIRQFAHGPSRPITAQQGRWWP